jgi:hypothetical protein
LLRAGLKLALLGRLSDLAWLSGLPEAWNLNGTRLLIVVPVGEKAEAVAAAGRSWFEIRRKRHLIGIAGLAA